MAETGWPTSPPGPFRAGSPGPRRPGPGPVPRGGPGPPPPRPGPLAFGPGPLPLLQPAGVRRARAGGQERPRGLSPPQDTGLRLEVVEGERPHPAQGGGPGLRTPPLGTRLQGRAGGAPGAEPGPPEPPASLEGLRARRRPRPGSPISASRWRGRPFCPSAKPLGVVLATDPSPGTPGAPGGGVRLLLSQGAREGASCPCPSSRAFPGRRLLPPERRRPSGPGGRGALGGPEGTVPGPGPAPGTPHCPRGAGCASGWRCGRCSRRPSSRSPRPAR